jgi:hypothetical protein
MSSSWRARLLGVAGGIVVAGAFPAAAGAVALTVTGDNGAPTPITPGLTIRNMDPDVGIGLAAGENARYSATFVGPDGVAAASPVSCFSIGTNRNIDFRGNGVYTVAIQGFAANDFSCRTPVGAPTSYAFTIGAGTALTAPAGRVLIREANSFTRKPVVLPIALNPGALTHEIRYAANGVVGPDGAISGASDSTSADRTTGTTQLSLTKPGRYVVVARAQGFSSSTGQFFTPWSPPVVVNAVAPFDIGSSRVLDSRGPSYRISVKLREESARGRVSIAYRRGSRGRFRSLGSSRLSSKGSFTKRFTIGRAGTYQMRFRFRGSSTVASGTVVQRFRISRRVVFP